MVAYQAWSRNMPECPKHFVLLTARAWIPEQEWHRDERIVNNA